MPTLKFTARNVESLENTTAKPVTFYDELITGLELTVHPSGKKTWSTRFRVGKHQRRYTLGRYPNLTLADAREATRNALREVAAGRDPAQAKQDIKVAETVGSYVETYMDKHAKVKKRSWKADQRQFNQQVLPKWRHRLMREITQEHVQALLDEIAERPAPIIANRVRALLHKFFNMALKRKIVAVNPVTNTERPGEEKTRDRILTRDEIRTFWDATESLEPSMRAFYRLRLLTAQRGGEVSKMRWADLDL